MALVLLQTGLAPGPAGAGGGNVAQSPDDSVSFTIARGVARKMQAVQPQALTKYRLPLKVHRSGSEERLDWHGVCSDSAGVPSVFDDLRDTLLAPARWVSPARPTRRAHIFRFQCHHLISQPSLMCYRYLSHRSRNHGQCSLAILQ